jgi:hypothetical protein
MPVIVHHSSALPANPPGAHNGYAMRASAPQEGRVMKVSIDIECTPEEARRAVGLPDLTPLHERYLAAMMQGLEGGVRPEAMEALVRSWAPMGDAGMKMWRQLFEQGGAKPGS